MLWYLLYPLRRTTEAPVLGSSHPFSRIFSRYGTWAARHVKTVLPLSIAVVFILLYPFPFLYTTDATNVTSGASNLPRHVWTDAKPLDERAVPEPDVIMRSIWVHGSYMKALDREVLLGALELQNEVLGPTTNFNPRQPANGLKLSEPPADLSRNERDTFHIVNGLTNQSWFFHSPLQYWGGSAENILADPDIISSVNAKKTQSTSVNVTLRHSIVFSGKRFEEGRLVAADALVMTLIHLRDSPVGRQWVRKAEALAATATDNWTVIPPDGRVMSSQLYEFQFQPMTILDFFMLSIAYCLTFLYLLLCLSKLRAVKSRLGLMVAILLQIFVSIGSSFTVCAIFKVDLSRIPYYAYPLVVLAISMENSFRLINAVIMSSNSNLSNRIGEAFGATAHVAVVNRLQNLVILWICSRVTFPGVAAFCIFAGLAIVFDFFFLSTFFLSVLSIDVQQRELSELVKASTKWKKIGSRAQPRPTWVDRVSQIRLGEVAVSTRVAGTMVVLGFILIAQAHYAPDSGRQWLRWIFSTPWRNSGEVDTSKSLLLDIHQARSPTSWLRLQDHETAREVINVVKPWAHSYVARVYDPLIFVLKGADRNPRGKEPYLLPAVYDFFHHEMPRFTVLLLILVGLLLMLTNWLLGDEFQFAEDPDHPEGEPLLSVKTLHHGHELDIARMAASSDGHLVTIGLDRVIQIWDVRAGTRSQVMFDPNDPAEDFLPHLGMAMDDDSKWLAFVTPRGVLLWSVEEQRCRCSTELDLDPDKKVHAFFSNRKGTAYSTIPPLVLVRTRGTMIELDLEAGEHREFRICGENDTLSWVTPPFIAEQVTTPGSNSLQSFSILAVSRKGRVYLVTQNDSVEWVSEEVKFANRREANAMDDEDDHDIHCCVPIPNLSMYLVGRSRSVDLVDLRSSKVIHTFPATAPIKRRTLEQTHTAHSTPQAGLTSLTLAYTHAKTDELIIQTYVANEDEEGDGGSVIREWSQTREITRRVENPGTWETLSNDSIVGVRRVLPAMDQPQTTTAVPQVLLGQSGHDRPPAFSSSLLPRNGNEGLLHRRGAPSVAAAATGVANRRSSSETERAATSPRSPTDGTATNNWEAWVMTHLHQQTKESDGSKTYEARPLIMRDEDEPGTEYLLVSKLGRMVKLGTMSVAVSFGHVIKVISVGHEYFETWSRYRLAEENRRNLTARRRRTGISRRA